MPDSKRKSRRRYSPEQVEERLGKLEREMEKVLTDVTDESTNVEELDPERRRQLEETLSAFADRMQERLQSVEPPTDERIVESAAQLFSPTNLMRLYGRLRMRHRSDRVDAFGADPKVEQRFESLVDFLYDTYFRVTAIGVENIPEKGRCLLVANRSGVLPWDAVMIKAAVQREHEAQRRVRWLIEDFVYNQPFLGPLVTQLGGVRACQEHAQQLLMQEEVVCVFPEGIIGATKLYKDRYKLGRFGRGGYVRLVLRTGTPIVPVAVVGAEEAHPVIGRVGIGGKLLGATALPVTPTFPAFGLLGLVPIPTKWTVTFGEPIEFESGPDAAEDLVQVRRLNEHVRSIVQTMVTETARHRRSVVFG